MADLDSIVKGAPIPGPDAVASASASAAAAAGTSGIETSATAGSKPGDPLAHTPSSPSMIYLNLLILEASLRAQYLELRARRRHHTFFLTLLTFWIVGFGYALFLAPREDGRGVGGSVYWVVEATEKVCFMGGIITAILVWGTGIWDRGVRWPRRWFGISNRGLRGFNCKLVVIRRPWWAELLSTVGFFLTYGLFSHTASSSYRFVDPAVLHEVDRELNLAGQAHPSLPIVSEDEEKGGREEDLAPGGDYVKLLLLAKPFSPTFRENWELYRTEYWERENERRALIRAKLRERERRLRKQHGGWFWWLPWRKVAAERPQPQPQPQGIRIDTEKGHHPRHAAIEREHRRTGSGSARRGSMSNHPSRSPTPTLEAEEPGQMTRRASTASNASDKKRKKVLTSSRSQKRTGTESRSVTPEVPSPLARESSLGSPEGGGRVLRNSASKSPAKEETSTTREPGGFFR